MNGEKGKSDGKECFTLTVVEVGHFLCGQFCELECGKGEKLYKKRLWK